MMTVIMGVYHAMSIYICGILIWLFIRERRSWERAILYMIAAVPFMVRILRIR